MTSSRFIYDIPEKNMDLYYATKFRAPDAVIFFEKDGKKFLVLSDLEIDRGKREAEVDEVLSLSAYLKKVSQRLPAPKQADVIHEVLKEHGIENLAVPSSTSFAIVDGLRERGIAVEEGPQPFYPERYIKTAEEKKYILEAQKTVFASISLARDVLCLSKIKGRRLIYKGSALTSEKLRSIVNIFLMEKGFVASDTIISCGPHAIDPHDTGSGPLFPNESIIVDVYPRSITTWYCGDATRTFCRGRASDALNKMFATVKEAQIDAIKTVKAGVKGRDMHESIHKFFESRGYKTGEKDGRKQGFFHGTGHSIGLEVHEEPLRINYSDSVLKEGMVMSVEPGLYYKEIGGVRIEDLVYITKSGCDVLARFPKELEV